MKIVVLCGGLSTERNISFLSGTKVCRALRSRGHQAVLVDLFMGLEDVTDDPASLFEELPELKSLTFDGTAPDLEAVKESRKWKSPSLFGKGVLEICRMADIVYVALHGMNGEDGRVQATFDMLGIPYTGSGYLGAAIAMDKMLTKEMIKDKGVRTPAWKTFHAGAITSDEDLKQTAEKIASEIEAPCVVKTPTGGSSVGVYIVTSQDAVRPAVEKCLSFGPDVLVEQMIEGREFTCAVISTTMRTSTRRVRRRRSAPDAARPRWRSRWAIWRSRSTMCWDFALTPAAISSWTSTTTRGFWKSIPCPA